MARRKWEDLTEADIEAACNINNVVADDRPLFADYAQIYLDNLNSDNAGTRRKYKGIPVSYTHLTLPTILRV